MNIKKNDILLVRNVSVMTDWYMSVDCDECIVVATLGDSAKISRRIGSTISKWVELKELEAAGAKVIGRVKKGFFGSKMVYFD